MSPSGGNTISAGVEFPSQRRERIDWHKLASIDLCDLTSGCPIEVLQENLTQVAFCDAEAEFDLGTLAGQRNLLKVFRLAQLTVQYLFLSQEFMETQLKEAQEEVDQLSEKYQQVKAKLVQQVDEARKMKATNRNMRETVKHINSFAINNGIFQAVRCPHCPKTFRSPDFLQAHLFRKHPGYAAASVSVPIPQAAPPAMPSIVSPAQVTLVPSAGSLHPTDPPVQVSQVPLATPEVGFSTLTGTHNPSEQSSCPPKMSDVDSFRLSEMKRKSETVSLSVPSKPNDVDSYRLNEIERKCETMSDNFLRLIRDLEEQKKVLEADHSRKQEEVKLAWEEKRTLEEHYEAQLEKLSRRVAQLQSTEVVHPSPADDDDLRQLIHRQEEELHRLRDQVELQAAGSRVDEIRGLDDVDGLQEQLQDLKRQLHEQERKHRRSLKEMQDSLQRNYEHALSLEKDKLKDMVKELSREEPVGAGGVGVAGVPHKPPPSPKSSSKPKKPPTPNVATKPAVAIHSMADSAAPSATPQPHRSQPHLMDADDTESETESDTDTSYWNQSKMKVKHLQISSKGGKETQIKRDKDSSLTTEEEEEEEEETGSEGTSESLHLDALLRDNPQLWGQMKEATSEVLDTRLDTLGIDLSSKGIKTDTLTSCLAQLRKDRRTLERKHDNFSAMRKRLENEVTAKVDDTIDNANDTTDDTRMEATDGKGRQGQRGVLSRMVKNVQSKVKERSKVIQSSVSKTGTSMRSGVKDMFQTTRSSNDVQVLGTHKDVGLSKDATVQDESSEEEEEDDEEEEGSTDSDDESRSARIEVHNETLKSVRRNLFLDPGGDSGTATGSRHSPGTTTGGRHTPGTATGARNTLGPRHTSGYFDNKTYGEESEAEVGWDSEPEYENMKEEPPKRTDSLRLSLEPADLHATPHSWQPVDEPQPIKLKRPTGEKVTGLARTIELQLSGRKKTKLAGAVDVTTGLEASKESAGRMSASQDSLGIHELRSASESSNTVRTSMWGSAEALGKEKPPRPSTSRGRIHSWDSEEDLDISDLE